MINRILQAINFLGVLAVAGLCVVQWRDNSRLNHNIEDLTRISANQTAKIIDLQATVKQDESDLDSTRNQLNAAQTAEAEQTAKFDALVTERNTLQNQNEQLKDAVTKLDAAVNDRNDALKKANDTINQISQARNEAVQKFNDIVDKYNALVAGKNQGK